MWNNVQAQYLKVLVHLYPGPHPHQVPLIPAAPASSGCAVKQQYAEREKGPLQAPPLRAWSAALEHNPSSMFLFQLLFPARAQHCQNEPAILQPTAICNLQPATCNLHPTCSERQVELSSNDPVNSNLAPPPPTRGRPFCPSVYLTDHLVVCTLQIHTVVYSRPLDLLFPLQPSPTNPLRRSDRDIQWNFFPLAPSLPSIVLRSRVFASSVCLSTCQLRFFVSSRVVHPPHRTAPHRHSASISFPPSPIAITLALAVDSSTPKK